MESRKFNESVQAVKTIDDLESNPIFGEFVESETLEGHWDIFIRYHEKSVASYFLKEADKAKLDLDNITFVKRDKLITDIAIREYYYYQDLFIELPYKENKERKFLFRIEFSLIASGDECARLAKNILIHQENGTGDCDTIAVIGKNFPGYTNELFWGNESHGGRVCFSDHIISKQPEHLYQKPDCLISQVLYSVWLCIHFDDFTKEQLKDKFSTVVQNVIALKLPYSSDLCVFGFIKKCMKIAMDDCPA